MSNTLFPSNEISTHAVLDKEDFVNMVKDFLLKFNNLDSILDKSRLFTDFVLNVCIHKKIFNSKIMGKFKNVFYNKCNEIIRDLIKYIRNAKTEIYNKEIIIKLLFKIINNLYDIQN